MSVIAQEKFSNFNKQQKETAKQISNTLSTLKALAEKAIEQQCYMRINPDNTITPEFIIHVGATVGPIAAEFQEVKERLDDIVKVMQESETPEDIATKYGVDVAAVSAELL